MTIKTVSALAGRAAIVGSAMVVHHSGDGPKKTPLELHVTAIRQAMADAGIDRSAVGALLTAAPPPAQAVPQFNTLVLNELKVAPRYTAQVGSHCAGALGSLQIAAALLDAGLVEYVVCSGGDANYWQSKISSVVSGIGDPVFEAPYGVTAPALYAQMACRYMEEYGVTNEQFARVAVANRSWAVDHPYAAMRNKGLLTIENVLASPQLASPLHVFDCSPWFPGGVAASLVVTSAEKANRHADPIYLRGFGQCTTHAYLTERLGLSGVPPFFEAPGLLRTGVAVAASQAYEMSGLTPADIDVVESSGPFSFFLLRVLEELGFCADGAGGTFVEDGGIDRDGGLPFNTFGGMLSFGQCAQALYPLIEAMDQLRGRAGPRQVPDAEISLVHGHGGPLTSQSVVLIGNHPS